MANVRPAEAVGGTGQLLGRSLIALAFTLVACSGPKPDEEDTPVESLSDTMAADAAGIPVESLVEIEEGFVAARYDADILQLVWIRGADRQVEVAPLGRTGEIRAGDNLARTSAYPVICPSDVGLSRTRFIVGEATGMQQLVVVGAAARGGRVVDGAYVLAFDPAQGPLEDWAITDEAGLEIVTSDPMWFAGPAPDPEDGDLCSVIRE